MSGGGSSDSGSDYKPGLGYYMTSKIPDTTITYGATGTEEPEWPTELGATIVDNGVTWKAIAPRYAIGTVTGEISRWKWQDDTLTQETNYFKYGHVKWLTGDNAGISCEVRLYQHEVGSLPTIQLLEAMPHKINQGDTYKITQGCPKTRAACKAFGNLLNFQGFPDMPTEERALTTPNFTSSGTSSSDDGGS